MTNDKATALWAEQHTAHFKTRTSIGDKENDSKEYIILKGTDQRA
jgi:hypothetical protein